MVSMGALRTCPLEDPVISSWLTKAERDWVRRGGLSCVPLMKLGSRYRQPPSRSTSVRHTRASISHKL